MRTPFAQSVSLEALGSQSSWEPTTHFIIDDENSAA